jgi:NTE family protein
MTSGTGDDIAFVLGGGGALGAHEVGMLKALAEHGVEPGLILGTSVGALNGALFAADPTRAGAERLEALWRDSRHRELFPGSLFARVGTLARTGTHVQPFGRLRDMLAERLPVERIEDLAVRYQCVAASIERAAEQWFDSGPLAEAVLASCAVPGVLPPVRIDGEHYLDGGIVNSIPVARALALGARTIYVLQVGRLERPLRPPRRPWEVGMVAFEIARRHRFQADMATIPEGIEVHVLPTGGSAAPAFDDMLGQLRAARVGPQLGERIEAARQASAEYLEGL